MELRARAEALFQASQERIVAALQAFESSARFIAIPWERPDLAGSYGGGGTSQLLRGGEVFEQAGVNFSAVYGHLPPEMGGKLLEDPTQKNPVPFYASGISLVIHPRSPMVPTTHANYRYLEVGDKRWFGGGGDLTPYILFDEDAIHFHAVLKRTCDAFRPEFYPRFKSWCDDYFYLPHRKEARGIGGIFFDYLGRDPEPHLSGADIFAFVQALATTWEETYVPIVERRRSLPWSQAQRDFQLQRRGRYVEFNLLYDRGTKFGLSTGGRIQSVFMSLPPLVSWDPYEANIDSIVDPTSDEARLLSVLSKPRDWIA